jgi:penicillin-binding protein 1A
MTPKKLFIALISVSLLAVVGIYAFVSYITSEGIPSITQLENPDQALATRVLSKDGVVLDYYYKQRRVMLPYDSIPVDFINALVATEDKDFFSHWGVHTERVFKAAIKNIFMGRREGASTITQQLARNLFLTPERSMKRKLREAKVAVMLEETYTKKEILQMYANTVYFGRGAYGIETAAQLYFSKDPLELELHECAFLAGLLKGPEEYNGRRDKEKAKRRRNTVLLLMLENGYISEATFEETKVLPITATADRSAKGVVTTNSGSYFAPHFVEMVRLNYAKMEDLSKYDLYTSGLTIHTTIDSRVQNYLNEAINEHLSDFQKQFDQKWNWGRNTKLLNDLIAEAIKDHPDYKDATSKEERSRISKKLRNNKRFLDSLKNSATTIQAGAVVIDPFTGEILAMVGASPKFMSENPDALHSLNHTTQIARQPGSSFKPFVYALALELGMTPYDSIPCGPYTYITESGDAWSPSGTGDCGPSERVSLQEGLRRSINTVAARLITQYVSPDAVVDLAQRAGIKSKLMPVPAIALGAGEDVKPIELASSYGIFPYGGYHVEPYSVFMIEDKYGNILHEQRSTGKITDALDKNIAVQMAYMMQAVVDGGTAYRIREHFKGVDAAGKTGTTNDAADAWFTGYTPQLVAGIWVGFDDRRITFDCIGSAGYGGRAAAPIWGRLMNKIYSDKSLPYKKKKFDFYQTDSTGAFSIQK